MSIVKPIWLLDYPEVEKSLHDFIDKLDKQSNEERKKDTVRYPINRKTFPLLWQQSGESDRQWDLIRSLDNEYGICQIKIAKKSNVYAPEFEGASICFYCSAEECVRAWLGRPYKDTLSRQWADLVQHNAAAFPGSIERLKSCIPQVLGKSSQELLRAFIRIAEYQQQSLTLRQLSARCFWGMSKVLENQEELILSLYPNIALRERPLIVNIHIPENILGCLFIENYDTYINAQQGKISITDNNILVYCSGFLGSARRIRQSKAVVFHYSSLFQSGDGTAIESWWFGRSMLNMPIAFWGDLDFSGMGILSALKKVFPEIQSWQAGYEQMLIAVQNGQAHSGNMASKQSQVDPGVTGCVYADKVLLPFLRNRQLFVDQEVV
jgi:hypothetical protein